MTHHRTTAFRAAVLLALLPAAWGAPGMLHAQAPQPNGAASPGAALLRARGAADASAQPAAPAPAGMPAAAEVPAPAPAAAAAPVTAQQLPAPAATPPQAPASPFAGAAPTHLPAPVPSTASPAPVRGLPSGSPSLAIAGGTYSVDPAQRFLIVNGQMVREGADLGGGIQLSAIRADSAVLTVQGRTVVVFF